MINKAKAVAEAVNMAAIQPEAPVDTNTIQSENNYFSYLILMAILFSILILAASKGILCLRSFLVLWGNEISNMVRDYLQKMALYSIIVCGIFWIVYGVYLKDRASYEVCLSVGEEKTLLFLMIFGSLIAAVIRYFSMGFAHSEKYNVGGMTIQNHYKDNVYINFSAESSIAFKGVINIFLKAALIIILLSGIMLYAPLPDILSTPLLASQVCLGGWHETPDTGFDYTSLTGIFLTMMLPLLTIIMTEHFCHIKKNGVFTRIPGYITVLNSPYVMIAMTCTWSVWICVLAACLFHFRSGAPERLPIAVVVYTCLDSVWLLILCVIAGRKIRTHNSLTRIPGPAK